MILIIGSMHHYSENSVTTDSSLLSPTGKVNIIPPNAELWPRKFCMKTMATEYSYKNETTTTLQVKLERRVHQQADHKERHPWRRWHDHCVAYMHWVWTHCAFVPQLWLSHTSHSMAQVLSSFTLHPWSPTMAQSFWLVFPLSTFTFSILSFTVVLFHLDLFFELHYKIVMANLRCSASEESDDTLNSFTSLTGNEAKFLTFGELNDSSVPFSFMIPSTDQDMDDVTLVEMLTAAHREKSTTACKEACQSVSQSSFGSGRSIRTTWCHTQRDWTSQQNFLKTSKFEQTRDRSGKPDERNSSNAQIRTLLEKQRQMIHAEYHEKVGYHELQAVHAEEGRRLLQGQSWRQQKDFFEVHQQNFTEIKELQKFQSFALDTIARRKLIADQNTILERSGRVQELQNEVNCINDPKDFQDAESVRSGNSHVTNQPMLFLTHPRPKGMLRPSFVSPSRGEGPPSFWAFLQIH